VLSNRTEMLRLRGVLLTILRLLGLRARLLSILAVYKRRFTHTQSQMSDPQQFVHQVSERSRDERNESFCCSQSKRVEFVEKENFTTKLPRTTLGTGLARTGTSTGTPRISPRGRRQPHHATRPKSHAQQNSPAFRREGCTPSVLCSSPSTAALSPAQSPHDSDMGLRPRVNRRATRTSSG